MKTPTTSDAPLGVESSDVLALAVFLARYQDSLNDLRMKMFSMTPEECKHAVLMEWPAIQGTQNQINLKRLGEMEYESPQVARAINAILGANDKSAGTAAQERKTI